jgi:hypothetical protein
VRTVPATAAYGPQGEVDIVLDMTTATTAASEKFSIIVTRAFKVIGVRVICTSATANGLVDVLKGAVSVTGTVPCASLNAVSDGSVVNEAPSTFAVGDTLNITLTAPGSGVKGVVIVKTAPIPLANQTTITGV